MWKLKIDINTTSSLIFQYRGGGRAKQWGVGGFLAQPAHHGSVFGGVLFFFFKRYHLSFWIDFCWSKVKVGPDSVVITGGQDETFTVRDTVIEYYDIGQVVHRLYFVDFC